MRASTMWTMLSAIVVLAVGDEDLLAEQAVVRAIGRGTGAHLREVRSPACGSVRFIVPVHSPLTIFGRKRSFWASA
jgi:hypothetical protein